MRTKHCCQSESTVFYVIVKVRRGMISIQINCCLSTNSLTHAWIADFLRNRTQVVILEGETSTLVPVTSGVPQGTVLGPILFLVYINDLPEYISNSTVRLFTDDCILYRQIDSTADCVKLQDDLDALQHWEDMWLMTFNAKKIQHHVGNFITQAHIF